MSMSLEREGLSPVITEARETLPGTYVAEMDVTSGEYTLQIRITRDGQVHLIDIPTWTVAPSLVPLITPAELRRAWSDKRVSLVDVRGAAKERAAGSIHLSFASIRSSRIDLPKNKEVVLYEDAPSNRLAEAAAKHLQSHGYRASVLYGGLTSLVESGWSIAADAPEAPQETLPPAKGRTH
jgi:rhodanese-related sulfurtransferase